MQKLHVLTYNIHKGFSQFHRHMVVHQLREQLRELEPDLVFLQEVQGEHIRYAKRIENWPQSPQYSFLAENVWQSTAYGKNVAYNYGHHGNAVLSRFAIERYYNQDVTHLRFERRGMLHCKVIVPGWKEAVHCVCVHLSLFAHSRKKQILALTNHLEKNLEPDAPLIIAGDFNDWQNKAGVLLAQRLGLVEIFAGINGNARPPERSFPVARPLLRLDRIYVRGFSVEAPVVHLGDPWTRISDHAALSTFLLPGDIAG